MSIIFFRNITQITFFFKRIPWQAGLKYAIVVTMKEFIRIVKFVCFSISAGLIEIGSFALLNELLHWPYWLSYMIALILSVLWNFTLNRKFTFKSAANVPLAMLKVAAYYAVFTPLSSWLEHVYTMQWGWNEYLATFVNMVLNLITEFLYQRFFVFCSSLDTQPSDAKNDEKPLN